MSVASMLKQAREMRVALEKSGRGDHAVQQRTALIACLKAGSNGGPGTLADLSPEERKAVADVIARAAAGAADADATFIAAMARKKFFADEGAR